MTAARSPRDIRAAIVHHADRHSVSFRTAALELSEDLTGSLPAIYRTMARRLAEDAAAAGLVRR